MTDLAIEMLLQLSAKDIIWLGEAADGQRGVDLLLVRDAEGKPALRETPRPDDIVVRELKVRTEPTLNGGRTRDRVEEVICVPASGAPFKLASEDKYDAVFWTESSIEKFVWPYYHSHRIWSDEIAAIKQRFDETPTALAIAHQAPSRSSVEYSSPTASLMVGVLEGEPERCSLRFMPAGHFCR